MDIPPPPPRPNIGPFQPFYGATKQDREDHERFADEEMWAWIRARDQWWKKLTPEQQAEVKRQEEEDAKKAAQEQARLEAEREEAARRAANLARWGRLLWIGLAAELAAFASTTPLPVLAGLVLALALVAALSRAWDRTALPRGNWYRVLTRPFRALLPAVWWTAGNIVGGLFGVAMCGLVLALPTLLLTGLYVYFVHGLNPGNDAVWATEPAYSVLIWSLRLYAAAVAVATLGVLSRFMQAGSFRQSLAEKVKAMTQRSGHLLAYGAVAILVGALPALQAARSGALHWWPFTFTLLDFLKS
jgi:hypothetical protein